MCRVFKVSRSGYYAFTHRKPSNRVEEDKKIEPVLRSTFDDHKRVYGCLRMSEIMKKLGFSIGITRTRRLMRKNNLRPQTPKWKPWGITKPDTKGRFSPDLVKRNFKSPGPNKLWTSDITWIFTGEGHLYLAVILDVHTRTIAGWSLGENESAELVIDAFSMACGRRSLPDAMIFHSDKGGQYCDEVLRGHLKKLNIKQSMNGHNGTWFDNAITETVFATIKKECVYKEDFLSLSKKEARWKLFDYIECFYNTLRIHSSIGYNSPMEYENKLKKT